MKKLISILVSAPVKDKKVTIQDFLFLENLILTIVFANSSVSEQEY